MDAKYYAYNQTRGCFLSGSLELVDAGHEPLRVLKVLIEGLTPGAKSGLWLTHFRSVPVARTLSPFDLVYLDSEFRVVHAVELSTDGEFAPFRGQPSSALVLPYQSLASTQTQPGDQLILRAAEDAPAVPSGQLRSPAPAPSLRKLTITAVDPEPKSQAIADRPAEQDRTNSPLEQFLAQQSAVATGRGRVQQTARSLRDLSSAERAPLPAIQPPVKQSAPAMAEPASEARAAQTGELRSGPARWPRIAPPSASAPPPRSPFGAASASSTPTPQDAASRKASWKVAQFPSRNSTAPAPPMPAVEPVEAPADEPAEKAPPEKSSLLMKILRLRFLRQSDQSDGKELEIPSPGLSGATPRTRSVPDWAMRFVRWLYPELDIATAAEIAVRPTYDARTKFRHEVKPSTGMKFFKWVYPELSFRHPVPELETPVDRRVSARLPQPSLVAYYFTGGPPHPQTIANISVTGFYMHTEERWMPGTIIRMTLQMTGSSGEGPTDTLTVHSRVVRWGPDGEGFEFVLAGFLDERLPISYGRRPRLSRQLNH